jgi:hypothetical protein
LYVSFRRSHALRIAIPVLVLPFVPSAVTASANAPRRDGTYGPPALRLITHDGLGRLDRWTLVPVDCEEERTTTWTSVDPSLVIDLEDRR